MNSLLFESLSHFRSLNGIERITYLLGSTLGTVCLVVLLTIFYYSIKQITVEILKYRQNRPTS